MDYDKEKKNAAKLSRAQLLAKIKDLKARHTKLREQVADAERRVRTSRALGVTEPNKIKLHELHVGAAQKDIEIYMTDIDEVVLSHWVLSNEYTSVTQRALTL